MNQTEPEGEMSEEVRVAVEITTDDAIAFLENAARNWSRFPRLTDEDVEDVRIALTGFYRRSSLTTQPSAGEWQDIASAPKPNTVIWLAMADHMRMGYWQDGVEHENFGTEGGGWIDYALAEAGRGPRGLRFAPSYWAPLPRPPRATQDKRA